jgi:hypothetical protein
MCWDIESDAGPMVNAPANASAANASTANASTANASMANALANASSAEPQYGGQGEFMSPSIVYPIHLY